MFLMDYFSCVNDSTDKLKFTDKPWNFLTVYLSKEKQDKISDDQFPEFNTVQILSILKNKALN